MNIAFFRRNATWLGTGMALAFGSSFGQTYFIALSAGGIRDEFGLTNGEWGLLYTGATVASATLLVQAGRLADTMPLRRLALLVMLGFSAVLIATATAGSVWVLALCVFGLRFFGQGMMSHISATAMARWFRANRGRAVSIASLGHSLGEAALPLATVPLILAFGWRTAWVGAAVLLALVLMPLILRLMKDGRLPGSEGPDAASTGLSGRHWSRGEVLRHLPFWLLMPGILAPSFIGTVVFFHQAHIAETKGWSLGTMALAYPLFAVVTVTATLVLGPLVDRVGPMRLLPLYLLPTGAAMLVLGLDGSVWIWFATLTLVGLTQGGSGTLIGTLWPVLYGTRHIGAVRSLATAAMVFATAAGPGITGVVIDLGVPFPDQGPALAAWCAGMSVVFWWLARKLARARAASPA